MKTIEWVEGKVRLIDQTRLPAELIFLDFDHFEELIQAIKEMRIRGAPALGVAGAYGLVLGAQKLTTKDKAGFLARLDKVAQALAASRPTAVNLSWALERMKKIAHSGATVEEIKQRLLTEAQKIAAEEEDKGKRLGRWGASLLPTQATVLTHCNAGALATVNYGTALGVIRAAREEGKSVQVYATETRPLFQGSRLTAWELMQEKIPVTIITDSAVGHLFQKVAVDCVIVGADRIAANGDVANKIGTYPIAVLAMEHGVPFYVAAPTSTIDLSVASGKEIPIEERRPEEITHFRGQPLAPPGVKAFNPAFDVTPHHYVSAIITEKGIVREPYLDRLPKLLESKD